MTVKQGAKQSISVVPQGRGFYFRLTARPVLVLTIGIVLLLLSMAGLSRLHKDTSISAFIPDDHPSLAANDYVKETFGLSDAMAIAVVVDDERGVFQPGVLALIDTLSSALAEVPNLRDDRIASITTESSIAGDDGAIDVEDYLPWFEGSEGRFSDEDAQLARDAQTRWQAMPPHQNTLVSLDANAAIIMAEMSDDSLALDTWKTVSTLVEQHSGQAEALGAELLLAGPGAVSGYFSAYINKDVRLLLPVGFVFVLLFVYLAFLRVKALVGPIFIIIATVGGALGTMGWMGVDYYAITNSLPVILVAIAVADAIHVLSAYYVEQQAQPSAEVRTLVVTAMQKMTRPVLFTSATTIAGFVGLGAVSIMPPISYFAWYAALGVSLACAYTLLVLPALLVLLRLPPSPAFADWQSRRGDWLGRGLLAIGQFARRRAALVVGLFALASLGAATVAGDLRIDRSQVENFRAEEPLRLADERINGLFAGTAFLNIVVTSDEPDGLLQPAQMQAVSELQSAFDAMPGVQKTISVVDYLSVLHAALTERPVSEDRILPTQDDALAQYLLVYETSGSPTDFEEELSPDYSSALIRGFLNQHRFSETRTTVEALMAHIEAQQPQFDALGLKVSIAGDVNIAYHWMTRLIDSHFNGIGLALFLVLLMASLMFRSPAFGLLAVLPVAVTVLSVYGVMAALGIYLDPPSSMFAAIAIGVGVDFSIHLISRLREVSQQGAAGLSLEQALSAALPETARACLFNALALAVGFSVMLLSLLPTLQRFGGFIALAALVSFVAALLLVPAVLALAQRAPAAAPDLDPGGNDRRRKKSVVRASAMAILVCLMASHTTETRAAESASGMTGLAVASKISERLEGAASERRITMKLVDKRGRERNREAMVIKHQVNGTRFTRITYLAPKPVREVSFLSHDKLQAGGADDRWLYLPATRKVRRIPASDRGDYFLGTDFSYEDMQSELKFALEDYDFSIVSNDGDPDTGFIRLRGVPKNRGIARELGYGAFEADVDPTNWMPTKIEFFNPSLKPLKTVTVSGIKQIDGVWNAEVIECKSQRTGHSTRFQFSDVRYMPQLSDKLFKPAALSRGAPEL